MNTERLERIAFNMENWDDYMTKLTGPTPVHKFNLNVWVEDGQCCAAGAVAMDKAFNAEGLTLARHGQTSGVPSYKGEHGLNAMALFLDISTEDAARFFIPSRYRDTIMRGYYISPKMVATRIRAYIEENTPEEVSPTPVKNLSFNFFKAWFTRTPAREREVELV